MKIIFSALFLVSCSTMVKAPGKTSKYAPEGYREKGIVEYLNRGADSIIEERREHAFKSMFDACGGRYQITREGNKTEFMSGNPDVWMIEFQCI